MHDLKIEIRPDGSVEILVEGYKGPDCEKLTKFLEEELGSVAERKHTEEYYEQPAEDQEQVKLGD